MGGIRGTLIALSQTSLSLIEYYESVAISLIDILNKNNDHLKLPFFSPWVNIEMSE